MLAECVECRDLVAPEIDEAFVTHGDTYLCWRCASRRGGIFDPRQERWVVLPDVANLPDERKQHPLPPSCRGVACSGPDCARAGSDPDSEADAE